MKKLILSALSLLFVLGSCQNEMENQILEQDLNTVTAVIENPNSRLAVSYDNATNIFGLSWSNNDAFKAFGENSTSAVYTWTEGNGFDKTSQGNIESPKYGIYPSFSEPTISGANVSLSLSDTPSVENINLPMWAKTEDGTSYAFKHLAAALRIDVKLIPAGYNTLTVESSKAINGIFTADLSQENPTLAFSGEVTDANKEVTVTFDAATEGQTKNQVFYIPLPVGEYESLTVTAKGQGMAGIRLKSWTGLNIVRGKMYYTTAVINASMIEALNNALAGAAEVPVAVNISKGFDAKAGVINIPTQAKEVSMNFDAAPTTTEEEPLTIEQNKEAQSGEATSKLNITIPDDDETSLYATINAPTTTATLDGGNYAKVIATTATNTLIIKNNVKISDLIIGGGNVVIEEEADVTNISIPENSIITYKVSTAEGLKSAVTNNNYGIIALTADITMSEILTITRSLVLDGNGHTLKYTGSSRAIDVPNSANGANLTLKNITVNCTSSYCQRGVNYNTNGALVLDNVTVNGENVTYALNLPASSESAEVTVNNCSLTGNIALNVWGARSIINVTDSHLTSVDKTSAENYTAIALNNNGSNIADGVVITINGGTITAKDENGANSSAISNSTNTGLVQVSETTTVVGDYTEPVAIITYGTDQFYSCVTLQRAIDKAIESKAESVKLVKDIELTESIVITAEGNVTLNLNGHNITATNCDAFKVLGTLTINATDNEKITASGDGVCAVWACGGNVTINGGHYSVGADSKGDRNDCIYAGYNKDAEPTLGTIVINGGKFEYTGESSQDTAKNGDCFLLNCADTDTGITHITVNGGQFKNHVPGAENYGSANEVSLGENKKVYDGETVITAAHIFGTEKWYIVK